MRRTAARVGDFLVYVAVRVVESFLRALPPEAAVAGASAGGTLWWLVDARRRRRVRENLRIAFPAGFPGGTLDGSVKAVFRNMMRVPVEAMVAPRFLGSLGAVGRRCELRGDLERAAADSASGRGAIVATGHLGNWEVAARVLAAHLPRSRFVVRPIDNPWIDRHIVRTRGGERAMIRKRGALAELARALDEGAWIGIVSDQDAGSRGRFVPFFGLPASTRATPALLAVRKDVPLYAAACLRRPGLFRFVVHLVRVEAAGASEGERVDAMLLEWTRRLEGWVREAPEQYNWLHRRWKTRPPGEAGTAPPAYATARAPG